MNIYRIALFGHRKLYDHGKIEKKLYNILTNFIRSKTYVEFLIGRNGDFDQVAASVIKRVQKGDGSENSEMTLVLPYTEKDIEYYELYYDNVIIPECMWKIHPKRAITKRNMWMVEECDLLICYVERESGGAFNALKYAQKLNKEIINLAVDEV